MVEELRILPAEISSPYTKNETYVETSLLLFSEEGGGGGGGGGSAIHVKQMPPRFQLREGKHESVSTPLKFSTYSNFTLTLFWTLWKNN